MTRNTITSLVPQQPAVTSGERWWALGAYVIALDVWLIVFGITAPVSAMDTAGCRVFPINFYHENLIAIEWTSELFEYDPAPEPDRPLRLDFHWVEMVGASGSPVLRTAIQNVYHIFEDDYVGIPAITPGLNLYWSSWLSDLQDGVQLDANPEQPPRFGRVFENIDGMGYVGNNIYNRESLRIPSPANPLLIQWRIERVGIVTDPPGQFTRALDGSWLNLIGTFVKWRCEVCIEGNPSAIATYYLPIEHCEYIDPTIPLNFSQEHFETNGGGLDRSRTKVRYSNMRVFDGIQWYPINEWWIESRVDDELGNNDNRFGWYSDGEALYSVCGDESYIADAHREPGTLLPIGDAAGCFGPSLPALCDTDCNRNGLGDKCDLLAGTSRDVNGNEIPDECELGGYAMLDLDDAFCYAAEINGLRYERYSDNRPGAVPGTVDAKSLSPAGSLSRGAGSAVFTGPTYTDPDYFYPYVQYESTRGFVWVHPFTTGPAGPTGEAACVAYTPPGGGKYRITGDFARVNNWRWAGDGVDVVVLVNTDIISPLFAASISSDHDVDADNPFAGTGVAHFDVVAELSPGDVLRFATFPGPPNGLDASFDATALRFSIAAYPPVDYDADGDVDGDDLEEFVSCAAGPSVPYAEGCAKSDYDADGDVDQDDFGILQRCYSGEDNPANPNCAN